MLQLTPCKVLQIITSMPRKRYSPHHRDPLHNLLYCMSWFDRDTRSLGRVSAPGGLLTSPPESGYSTFVLPFVPFGELVLVVCSSLCPFVAFVLPFVPLLLCPHQDSNQYIGHPSQGTDHGNRARALVLQMEEKQQRPIRSRNCQA
jgi:hypothetical protein